MKRLLFAAALIVVALAVSAQVVVYEDDAQLYWEASTLMADGSPILPGDVVFYDVYYYDLNNPIVIDNQDTGLLAFAGTTTDAELTFTFPERREWAVGVRGTLTDGGGVSGPPSRISWSIEEEFVDVVAMGGPFYFIPHALMFQPMPLSGLKDQRY